MVQQPSKEINRSEGIEVGHSKMSREERAKQFMPFAALKGYPEALHQKEKMIAERQELSEEYKEELDLQLQQIIKNKQNHL